jgi:hypothetical protein
MFKILALALASSLVVGCAPVRINTLDRNDPSLIAPVDAPLLVDPEVQPLADPPPAWVPSIGWAKCFEIDDSRMKIGAVAKGTAITGAIGGGLTELFGAFDDKTGRIVKGLVLIGLGAVAGSATYIETNLTQRWANFCEQPVNGKARGSDHPAVQ